ncbi:uncharacterized protein LOC142170458 [Nicotiana tabacum]|uniref:Uncharacterized protein LOC142170458 n=1 Tax=Nicotiana tabacum TaxID=4097 RepID=A0AC58SU23_TOBAC
MGYSFPSKCWCCVRPEEESVAHVFFTSYAAKKVWTYFFSYAGLSFEGLSLQQAIVRCWSVEVIPRLKPIFQALPCIIVWELWKRRNSNKHDDPVSINRVVHQICTTIQSLVKVRKSGIRYVPQRWPDVLHMMENYMPRLRVTKVTWEFPIAGWTKINSDGASRGNPGRSSIGFCLRNEQGDLIYAVGKEIDETTNTQAEARAILEALRYCTNIGISQIWLETDSILLKNTIEGNWKPPWIIEEEVEEIKEMIRRCNGRVSHIYREGNKLADHLANYALNMGNLECHELQHLDTKGRRLVNVDKLRCPNLKIKVVRS